MDNSAAATERIIERFGGIRPMAAKLSTPVTTVQGWKKRGIIPQSRHADILAAAERESIAIDAAELAGTDPGTTARPESRQNEPDIDAPAPIVTAPSSIAPQVVRAPRSHTGAAALTVSLLLVAAAAGGGFTGWRYYLEPLRARVAKLEAATSVADENARRLAKLEGELATMASRPATSSGPETTGANASDRERLAAIERQLAEAKTSTSDTEQLAKRLSDLQIASGGRELLAQSIRDIQSSSAATQGELERVRTQLTAFGARLDQVDAVLAERRHQALRAEAVVLAVGQLRTALRDSKPFTQDISAVRALIDGDPDMLALLDRIQPLADEGAPTIDDLSKDFGRLAPEIVRSAIVGDGASWWRQALYHVESAISIRRVGSTVPGDDVDAIVARAEGKLEEDDVQGAVTVLRALKGLPAEQASPWMHDAGKRIAVDAAEADLTRLAIERVSAGPPQAATPTPVPAPAPAPAPTDPATQ